MNSFCGDLTQLLSRVSHWEAQNKFVVLTQFDHHVGVEAWHSSSGLDDTGVNDVTSVSDDIPTALHVGLHLLLLRSWTLCCLRTIMMFLVRREEEEEQEVSDVWKYNEVSAFRVLSSMFTSVHKAFTTCHQAAVYRPAVRRFKTCVWITSTPKHLSATATLGQFNPCSSRSTTTPYVTHTAKHPAETVVLLSASQTEL